MSKRIWHSGPPPHVGWWNASRVESEMKWRWWNGYFWSYSVKKNANIKTVTEWSTFRVFENTGIFWTTYYPRNARVPRIDPRRKS